MNMALRYFADFYSAFHGNLGVYPPSLLDLVAFVVGVVGLEHIILLGHRPPLLPSFLYHPPASLSYPQVPLFTQLHETLLTAAKANGPPTFMRFVIDLVGDFGLEKVLCQCRPLSRSGHVFIVDSHFPTQDIRYLNQGAHKSSLFKPT